MSYTRITQSLRQFFSLPLGGGDGLKARGEALIVLFFFSIPSFSQWMNLNRHYDGVGFALPVECEMVQSVDFDSNDFLVHYLDANGEEQMVPYSREYLDSISFSADLTDEEKGHNQARVFTMNITTVDGKGIYDRDNWIDCFISIDGKGEYSNFSGSARIKGRGNSSWEWYDKKPYKFKLDTKSKILGLDKAKNWNLLANFRDVTKLENVHAFNVARYLGMPHTCHSRSLEVFLNGEYIGLYQLTEKIEINKNRVDIDEDGGVLLAIDQDDGPDLSPSETNNFWSKVYYLPVAVKYPEDITSDSLEIIRNEFATLEHAIQQHNYDLVESLMDIPSFISLIQLHEYLYNVEIDAPRSIYLYRDKNGKYTWGPVWDWDAGYDFDWGNMYTGHTFFTDYRELILGTDPYNNTGAAYSISNFWRDMFQSKRFVTQYKDAWDAKKDSLFIQPWATTEAYYNGMQSEGAYTRDADAWPVDKTVTKEVDKMKKWLQNRLTYLNSIIPGYPEGTDDVISKYDVCGTVTKTVTMKYADGYSQSGSINISQVEVGRLLGGTPTSLVALNADGEEGTNTAAGTYGAWFDADGNTANFSTNVHVFIESDDMWAWNYGLKQDNCASGDTHVVTMQYRLNNKAVNVVVTFKVDPSSGGDTGDDDDDDSGIVNGVLTKSIDCTFSTGYHQSDYIEIDEDAVEEYLGSEAYDLVPLNSDGTLGNNTAAGSYGAWFDADGDTNSWAFGHVYIESDDLWEWDYGCHPDNCQKGDTHTVMMRYQGLYKHLDVKVTFNVK